MSSVDLEEGSSRLWPGLWQLSTSRVGLDMNIEHSCCCQRRAACLGEAEDVGVLDLRVDNQKSDPKLDYPRTSASRAAIATKFVTTSTSRCAISKVDVTGRN